MVGFWQLLFPIQYRLICIYFIASLEDVEVVFRGKTSHYQVQCLDTVRELKGLVSKTVKLHENVIQLIYMAESLDDDAKLDTIGLFDTDARPFLQMYKR